ncbi:MAG: type I-E CRISPR-associated protein Cas6/Cse3/CasE [Bifidobacteriaceae bacterium]|jgi:CRISPR system Cascade subunit CasE|nr:type I-E CRISPR-associated protein Cas6/Cse3/CasE [Bifidobacteriaceae bacterium]MCI1979627.1 type I-E CRISPR-associated protein Cas6/Cse3/CasE [Bifidobacteriaceae bacterium]
MTEFTRIKLNPRDRRVRAALASPERFHAIIARATDGPATHDEATTSERSAASDQRTLWRFDASRQGRRKDSLYIVSAMTPSAEILTSELGIESENDFATCAYEPFLQRLETGQEWGFRLMANPTRSLPSGYKSVRGKREGLVRYDDQISWIETKASQNGFHMTVNRLERPEVIIRESAKVKFDRKSATVTLTKVVFEGILAIDNPERVRKALTEGIGRAKGYGYGLLTLIPLTRSQQGNDRE